jgi:hypothetical protein
MSRRNGAGRSDIAGAHSQAIANSAILMALLDSLIAKGIFEKSEVQSLVKDAIGLVGNRGRSPEGSQAVRLLNSLWGRFCAR